MIMELYEIMCVKLLKIVKHWQESYDKPRQCVKKAKISLFRQRSI